MADKPLLDVRYKMTPQGPLATVRSNMGYEGEELTPQELEKLADHIRAKAKELRASSDRFARSQRSKW
jgi:hypothetical protein